MDTPSPTNLPATVTVPVSVTSGSTISHSGIGTTHWCIQVKNSTESFVFNETGQVTSATTCLADGTTNGNAQAQTGKAVPGVPGLVTAALPAAAEATAAGGIKPYNTATISWIAPTPGDAAISKYVVTTYPGGAQCQTTGAITCTIPGLTAGASYAFNVVASNAYGNGLPSDLSANITVATTPDAPTTLGSMWTSNGALNIGWTAAANHGAAITGSTIQASTSPAFASGITTVTVTGNATNASITGLTVGSTYYYRVKSTNVVGDGPYATADTSQTVIPTPTNLTYTNMSAPNYGTNRMSWTPVTCIAGFTPEYYLNEIIQNGVSGTFNNSGWITGTVSGATRYYDLPAAWTVQGSTYGFQIAARCVGTGVTSIASPYASSTTGTSQAQGDLLGWTQDTLTSLTKAGWTVTDTRDINHRVPKMPGVFTATSPDNTCTVAAFLSPYATEFATLPDKAISKDFANQYLTSVNATNETPTDAKPFTPIKATYSKTPLDAVTLQYTYPATYTSADLIPTPTKDGTQTTPTTGTMHANSIFIASPANGNAIDPNHLNAAQQEQLKNTTLIPVYQLTYRCLNTNPDPNTWKQLLTDAQTTMTSDPALLPDKTHQTLAPQ